MSAYAAYEQQKAAWLRANPEATPEQIEAAFIKIARELGI